MLRSCCRGSASAPRRWRTGCAAPPWRSPPRTSSATASSTPATQLRDLPNLRARLAEMCVRTEQSRALLGHTLDQMESGVRGGAAVRAASAPGRARGRARRHRPGDEGVRRRRVLAAARRSSACSATRARAGSWRRRSITCTTSWAGRSPACRCSNERAARAQHAGRRAPRAAGARARALGARRGCARAGGGERVRGRGPHALPRRRRAAERARLPARRTRRATSRSAFARPGAARGRGRTRARDVARRAAPTTRSSRSAWSGEQGPRGARRISAAPRFAAATPTRRRSPRCGTRACAASTVFATLTRAARVAIVFHVIP